MGALTLRPNGDGTYKTIKYCTEGSNHYTAVDESSPDEDSTYVGTNELDQQDTYTLENHTTETGDISAVTVYWRMKRGNTLGIGAKPMIRLGSTDVKGTLQYATTSYTDYSETLSRPGGGSWSWSDIDSLEAGINILAAGYGYYVYVTQVWVVVTYASTYTVTTTRAIGLVKTNTQVLTGYRSTSKAIGMVKVNTRRSTIAKSTSKAMGMLTFNQVVKSFSTLVAMGMAASASRLTTMGRVASSACGMAVSNVRGIEIVKSTSKALGMVTTNIRVLTKSFSTAVEMGLTASANKLITAYRSAISEIGMIPTNVRAIEAGRTGSVILGLLELAGIGHFMAGKIKVWINGVRKTAIGLVRIQQRIEERSTASFGVRDLDFTEDIEQGEPVILMWDDQTFTGFVESADIRMLLGKGGLIHHLQCKDNHYLADKRIAVASYESKTCGYVVNDLITNYLAAEGITAGTIQDGPTITEAIINYVTVADALNALAEKAGFIWYIDENKVLYFMARETVAASWELTSADVYGDISITRSNPLYRNKQYVRGGKALTSQQVESRIGDSVATAFTMSYPLAKVPTITLDTVPQTVGIKGIDTGKDWYWSKGDAVISQDAEGTPITPGQTLEVTYYGQFDLIAVSEDSAEIVRRASIEGNSGIDEDIADEPTASSTDAVLELAAAKLYKYARDGKRFAFQTLRAGLKPGQLLTIDYPDIGIEDDLLIESVSVVVDETHTIYNVVAIEGPELGSWTKFFAELAAKKLSVDLVSVGSGSTLTVVTSPEDTTEWSEDVTPTVLSCPVCGDATLCGVGTIVC